MFTTGYREFRLYWHQVTHVIKVIVYKITAKLLVVCTMYIAGRHGHAALLEQMVVCSQYTCTLSYKVRHYTGDSTALNKRHLLASLA